MKTLIKLFSSVVIALSFSISTFGYENTEFDSVDMGSEVDMYSGDSLMVRPEKARKTPTDFLYEDSEYEDDDEEVVDVRIKTTQHH